MENNVTITMYTTDNKIQIGSVLYSNISYTDKVKIDNILKDLNKDEKFIKSTPEETIKIIGEHLKQFNINFNIKLKSDAPLKQISLRIDAKQLKEMKQYCLDNDTDMTASIKAGLYLLKNSKLEGDTITVSVNKHLLEMYAGIEL